MAWDEWEQLKAGAKERGSTHMQLNHLADPVDGGGGPSTYGDLKVSNSDLAQIGKEAVRTECGEKAKLGCATPNS